MLEVRYLFLFITEAHQSPDSTSACTKSYYIQARFVKVSIRTSQLLLLPLSYWDPASNTTSIVIYVFIV